jgi:hypothetical protein
MMRVAAALVALGLLTLTSCAASESGTGISSPHACGTNLGQNLEGYIYDATSGTPRLNVGASGGTVFIRVADGCAHGSALTWRPRAAATIEKVARAHDGLPVIVLMNVSESFILYEHTNGVLTAKTAITYRTSN